jgi:hypothetical protein
MESFAILKINHVEERVVVNTLPGRCLFWTVLCLQIQELPWGIYDLHSNLKVQDGETRRCNQRA